MVRDLPHNPVVEQTRFFSPSQSIAGVIDHSQIAHLLFNFAL